MPVEGGTITRGFLEGAAEDGPSADELREAVRAYAVDPGHRHETVLGTLGFGANGDST